MLASARADVAVISQCDENRDRVGSQARALARSNYSPELPNTYFARDAMNDTINIWKSLRANVPVGTAESDRIEANRRLKTRGIHARIMPLKLFIARDCNSPFGPSIMLGRRDI
jgi:hypothetical protein